MPWKNRSQEKGQLTITRMRSMHKQKDKIRKRIKEPPKKGQKPSGGSYTI